MTPVDGCDYSGLALNSFQQTPTLAKKATCLVIAPVCQQGQALIETRNHRLSRAECVIALPRMGSQLLNQTRHETTPIWRLTSANRLRALSNSKVASAHSARCLDCLQAFDVARLEVGEASPWGREGDRAARRRI